MPLVSKTFSEIITFTRASTGTYFDAAGTLQTAATNGPRLDYNPSTLAAQGLLIEESRTNSIRNNTMVGAVAGTPGTLPTNWPSTIINGSTGLTSEIVSIGTEDGISYLDYKVSGTAVGAGSLNFSFEPNTQIVASQNQVWTVSMFRRLIAGSFNGLTPTATNIFINSYAAGGAFDANAASVVRNESIPTSAALKTQRATLTGTLSSATTARVNGGMFFTIANAAAIDITLRIGLPQLEQGAFATSVIPTTTTALTRAADVASVNTLSPWYNATEGTFVCQFRKDVGVSGRLLVVDNGASGLLTNGINLDLVSATQARTEGFAASAAQWDLRQTIALGSTQTVALGYATNSIGFSANGATPTTDSAATVPSSGMTTVALANWNSANYLNGYLRRITYYPRRLSNAELQTLTT
jgi:hypothetical protein